MICAKEESCAFWFKPEKADSFWCLLSIPDRAKVDESGCKYYRQKGTPKEELLKVAEASLASILNLDDFKPTIIDKIFRPGRVTRFETVKHHLIITRVAYSAIYRNEISRLPW